MCVLYDYRYGIFVCKCVSVSECKLCYIIYVVVQRAKRKTAVAILVPQFSYFNFHMNFSCKLTVYIYIYIYICFLCMKIENKFYYIQGQTTPAMTRRRGMLLILASLTTVFFPPTGIPSLILCRK